MSDSLVLPPVLPKYQKVLQLGDPRIARLLEGPVVVEEKLDGSNFRFGNLDGKVLFGSHHVDFTDDHPADQSYIPGIEHIKTVAELIPPNWVFFGEFLGRPRQNTITYARVPAGHVMLFDAFSFECNRWATIRELQEFATILKIDPPVVLWSGIGTDLKREQLDVFIHTSSYLGNSLMEGVVVKNYDEPSGDRYTMGPGFAAGKFVSPAFKEDNKVNWHIGVSVVDQIVARFKSPMRWEKARQRLRDDGMLEGSMRDMRGMLTAVEEDMETEMRPEIERMLYENFQREILKGIRTGMAEWLKQRLADEQFCTESP